ncbi:DNA/RNA polymerases superfamily protein [Arachis hypogaea]|nr:DNA/RNA polymerases superfamily protein [Arachis hypogaea]
MPPKKRRGGAVNAPATAESNRAVSPPLGALRQRPRSQRIADRRGERIPREGVQENPAVGVAQADLTAELRGMNQTLNAVLQVLTNQNRGGAGIPNMPNPQPHRVHQLFGDQEPPIEKYLKLNSSTFNGDSLDEDPQQYLEDAKKAIRALRCTKEWAVELVSYNLRGSARYWYESLLESKEAAGLPPPSWEEFTDEFLARFYPANKQAEDAIAFERLRQENMTVTEYAKEFTRLSKSAPYLVNSEEMKVRRFVRGLAEPMFTTLMPEVGRMSFKDVLNSAYGIEAGIAERNTFKDVGKKPKMKGQFSGGTSSGEFQSYHGQTNQQGYSGYRARPQASFGGVTSSGSAPMSVSTPKPFVKSTSQSSAQGSNHTRPAQPYCLQCGSYHSGICIKATGACFGCGQSGHLRKDCPNPRGGFAPSIARPTTPMPSSSAMSIGNSSGPSGRGAGGRGQTYNRGGSQRGRGQARVYALTRQDAQASNAVVAGTLQICSLDARVLFDTGSHYSYVSPHLASHFDKQPELLSHPFHVGTPLGVSTVVRVVFRFCIVRINTVETLADLILLEPMQDIDVILGMDWLAACHADVGCYSKTVKFDIPGISPFVFKGDDCPTLASIISSMSAMQLMDKGNQGFLAVVRDVNAEVPSLDQVPIVREFSDVFPDELPGMPPVVKLSFP